MPNWKKLLVSGSNAELNRLNVSTSFTASGIHYPTSDGLSGQFIQTDGLGNLSFSGVSTVTENVKNVSGHTLYKGTPVHATGSGTMGNIVGVIPASASIASSMPATFILAQTLTSGSEGLGIISGLITGVDTSAFQNGEIIYVGPSGGYTNVAPTGSNLIQNLGIVTKVHPTNGGGVVLGAGRANATPNLLNGQVFYGTNNRSVARPLGDIISGSIFNYTGSFSGDGSSLTNITVAEVNTVTASFASTSSITVVHNFNTKNVIVSAYDSDDFYFVPNQVKLLDNNRVKLSFTSPSTGYVVVAKGGHLVSGSLYIPGAQGSQGPMGLQGTLGTQGFQGNQGIQGTAGAQGNQGPTGIQGTVGTQGFQGNQGPTGAQGSTGASAGITSYTNPADNRVLTSVSSTSINAEANLIFDGTNLGIGTTSPSQKLHINSGNLLMNGTFSGVLMNPGTGAGSLAITRSGTFISNVQQIDAPYTDNVGGDSGGGSQIQLLKNQLAFSTFPTTASAGNLITLTEIMRITSIGVGIGTTSPSAELEISKAQSTGAVLKLTNPTTSNTSQDLGTLGFVSGDTSTNQANLIRASVKGIAGELSFGTGGQLVFSTMQTFAGSGTLTDLIERMRITSSGAILIGTTIASMNNLNGVVISPTSVGVYSNSGNGVLAVGAMRGAVAADIGGQINFQAIYRNSDDDYTNIAYIKGLRENATDNNWASYISFETTNATFTISEKMRITSTGRVLITTPVNSTEATSQFSIAGSGYVASHWLDGTAYYIGQNSTIREIRMYSGASTAGVRLTNGSTSWSTYSDERLKTNIEDIGLVLSKLKDLRTVKYHLKDVDENNRQKRYGLIAQDLVGKFDEVLSSSNYSDENPNKYYDLRYTEMIPILVKAIQELSAQIDILKQENINIKTN